MKPITFLFSLFHDFKTKIVKSILKSNSSTDAVLAELYDAIGFKGVCVLVWLGASP